MSTNGIRSWEEFLNPEVVRPRLIAASIYIAGFEILKNSIVAHIRRFFSTGFDASGLKMDGKYQAEVLARNKSPVHASLDWLRSMHVIDDADVQLFDRLKACRNTLAHELLSTVLSEGLPDDFVECLTEMAQLLRKIEIWWIINVEIPTDPDFDGRHIKEDDVIPGPVMALQLLLDVALGDEERSRSYYNEWRKLSERS